MFRSLIGLTLVLAVGGCDAGNGGDASLPPQPPFQPLLDDHQMMTWVMDPAADVIWGSAGSVLTEAGEESLAPTDGAGWDRVRNAAAMVAESGNLLMLPGRSQGADWDEFAGAIVTMGERAIGAAEARDEEALFEVGGQLYNVCVACHQIYMRPEEEE